MTTPDPPAPTIGALIPTDVATLSEPDCCGLTPSGYHTARCPLALSYECDDCGSGPGFECFPYCYCLLGLDDDDTVVEDTDQITILAVIDEHADEAVRWWRVVNMVRPYVSAGSVASVVRDGDATESAYPLAPGPPVPDSRYSGWIDLQGMSLLVHHRSRPFTPGTVLAVRAGLQPAPFPPQPLLAVPVRVNVICSPIPQEAGACRCGHLARDHDGCGPAWSGCARWRDHGRWCGCLAYTPGAPGSAR